MTTIELSHAEQALEHAQRAIAHYEKLLAGDGITCADLVVFGAELRAALKMRADAEHALQADDRDHLNS